MQDRSASDTTGLLERVSAGEREAFDELYTRLYRDLGELARAQRRRQGAPETLDTTAVVHEAYARLAADTGVSWKGRAHFFAIAARTMRRVIVDYARERGARKRGAGRVHVTLRSGAIPAERRSEDILIVDDVLSRLAAFDERLERVAECRLFGGLTQEETAAALGTSVRTVQRDWRRARAWLEEALSS
jgi:RNA polymerase sigma-70 factor, ECF subfamily